MRNLTGLLANVATYGSYEKKTYDRDGNQIIDETLQKYKIMYRSTENLAENENIAEAIEQQRQELKESGEKETKKALDEFRIDTITQGDIMSVINQTNAALEARIFGPMWNNWTNGTDFLAIMKDTLENLINTFDPLMDLVDQIQDYVNGPVADQLEGIDIKTYKTRSGQQLSLPLGVIAIQALNMIINYIRELIKNIERLAEEYTVEEINALLNRGTNGSSFGTAIKTIQDLIQMIVNCIKPYIQNLVMALILDAIDMIVDVLKKAGLLEPKGPFKLIPVAITLVRSIMAGNLEAIEQMVVQSISKMINIVQLAMLAIKDPSILWADTDRMDKEIAVARYDEMMANGTFNTQDFLGHRDNLTAGARHFLQKLKNESADTFSQIVDFASTYTDLNALYQSSIASQNAQKENDLMLEKQTEIVNTNIDAMRTGVDNCAQERQET